MSTYIDSYERRAFPGSAQFVTVCTQSWREHTARNLAWHYPDRAAAIMAGNDPATQSDMARWAKLGRRDAA